MRIEDYGGLHYDYRGAGGGRVELTFASVKSRLAEAVKKLNDKKLFKNKDFDVYGTREGGISYNFPVEGKSSQALAMVLAGPEGFLNSNARAYYGFGVVLDVAGDIVFNVGAYHPDSPGELVIRKYNSEGHHLEDKDPNFTLHNGSLSEFGLPSISDLPNVISPEKTLEDFIGTIDGAAEAGNFQLPRVIKEDDSPELVADAAKVDLKGSLGKSKENFLFPLSDEEITQAGEEYRKIVEMVKKAWETDVPDGIIKEPIGRRKINFIGQAYRLETEIARGSNRIEIRLFPISRASNVSPVLNIVASQGNRASLIVALQDGKIYYSSGEKTGNLFIRWRENIESAISRRDMPDDAGVVATAGSMFDALQKGDLGFPKVIKKEHGEVFGDRLSASLSERDWNPDQEVGVAVVSEDNLSEETKSLLLDNGYYPDKVVLVNSKGSAVSVSKLLCYRVKTAHAQGQKTILEISLTDGSQKTGTENTIFVALDRTKPLKPQGESRKNPNIHSGGTPVKYCSGQKKLLVIAKNGDDIYNRFSHFECGFGDHFGWEIKQPIFFQLI